MNDILYSVYVTFAQSLLSALVSLFLGFLGALGALSISNRGALKVLSFLALLPNWIPVLFVILSILYLMNAASGVKLGLGLVVFTHSFMNSGIVAVALLAAIKGRLGGVLELCAVEGAKRPQTLRALAGLIWPEMRVLFFLVFSICMVSFAVPLVMGGGELKTLEVFIFEQVRIYGNFGLAVILSFLQLLLLILASLFFQLGPAPINGVSTQVSNVSWRPGLVVLLFPAVVLLVGLTAPFFSGDWWSDFVILENDIVRLLPNTLILAILTSALVFVGLQLVVYFYSFQFFQRALYAITIPSYALIGFALFMIPPRDTFTSLIKISFGLAVIFLPILYKLFLAADFARLKSSFDTAQVLGSSRLHAFRGVMWPQLQEGVTRSALLAGFWALGDFALSTVVALDTITLPLLIRDLLNSYRFELATVLSCGLVLLSLIIYLIVIGSGRVFGQESS